MAQEIWPMTWPEAAKVDELAQELRDFAEMAAANAMRFLTLYRVGGSPISVRPCGSSCRNPHYFMTPDSAGFHPYLTDNGMYANCWCGVGCRCDEPEGIYLAGPVGAIEYVRIDGALVPATDYYLVNGVTLVRTVGTWPGCRSRMEVRYTQGYEVDAWGMVAGGVLAAEFVKARLGDTKCRLPSNITNITRSGVQMQFQTGMFPDMLTGIKEVDTYLVQWNPNGKRQAPGILSPDLDEPQQVRYL